MATASTVQTQKFCKVCQKWVAKNVWRFHSSVPCITHIDNQFRNEMEELHGEERECK